MELKDLDLPPMLIQAVEQRDPSLVDRWAVSIKPELGRSGDLAEDSRWLVGIVAELTRALITETTQRSRACSLLAKALELLDEREGGKDVPF